MVPITNFASPGNLHCIMQKIYFLCFCNLRRDSLLGSFFPLKALIFKGIPRKVNLKFQYFFTFRVKYFLNLNTKENPKLCTVKKLNCR